MIAIITVTFKNGYRPSTVFEALKRVSRNYAGLLVVKGTVVSIEAMDEYSIILTAYSEDLRNLLKAVRTIEEAYTRIGGLVEARLRPN